MMRAGDSMVAGDWAMSENSTLEWEAWRRWTQEFNRVTGLDFNEDRFRDLCACVNRWGEELVALRKLQPDEIHTKALDEYRERTEAIAFT
jgi:hypothetical protein